jgi:predicted metalloprotease
MDIRGRRQSTNIEDRRGSRVRTGAGLSIGGILVLIVLSLLGINPLPFLGMATKEQSSVEAPDQPYQESAEEAKLHELTAVVLADTEDTWSQILPKYGIQYVEPRLVLFSDSVESDCGAAQAAMGPFYCPADQKVYVDLSFYHELSQRFGAGGDAAQAYVVAHEVGHHVQNLVGTAGKVSQAQQQVNREKANELSVRLELQADCFAGVWLRNAEKSRGLLEPGDIEEALNAAAAIGDDRLSQGRVGKESFTHGSSQQRQTWLRRGLDVGTPEACATFEGAI